MSDLIALPQNDYELLDSGNGVKLERLGNILVERPSPQSIWSKKLSENEWKKTTSKAVRQKDGGGKWEHKKGEPQDLIFKYPLHNFHIVMKLKFTSFGHCGIFFEQMPVWETLYQETLRLTKELGRPLKVLNLFGYTGAASIAMAHAGAQVFHVDSSKGVLTWGRESAELSKVEAGKINWVQEDVMKFLIHSHKKGFKYDGVLADPPSWGHGANKEVWEFEKDIDTFSLALKSILADKSFFFLSTHTHGVQKEALRNILLEMKKFKKISVGDLNVKHAKDERLLPAGLYALGTI
jgi:23S rRNA (cytosine1962-C5)-methyltransferase